jgi:twitching motility protein PilT
MDIKDLLAFSVKQQASDLHLLPGLPPLMRIQGELVPLAEHPPLTADDTKNLIYNLLSPTEKQAFENKLVIDIAINLPTIGNFRASILHQLHGVAGVFRIIPPKIPTVDELGLPLAIKSLAVLSQGLVVLTGPTGSGKSTTLAALINYINNVQSRHIITIEDPIEFVYQSKKSIFNQLQVGRDTPDFATALRASLRQDPNVILVGEMRDLETIRLALTAAETGHLVLSTLHAASAAQAVSRIVDVFPLEEKDSVRHLLAETFQALIYQTLVKRAAGGRVAAFEILLPTIAIRNYLRQDMVAHIESSMQMGKDKGMCTLEQYLQDLASKGIISQATAQQIMINRGEGKNTEKTKAQE